MQNGYKTGSSRTGGPLPLFILNFTEFATEKSHSASFRRELIAMRRPKNRQGTLWSRNYREVLRSRHDIGFLMFVMTVG